VHVDILLELQRIGLAFEPREGALKARCPFHDDQTPSLDVFLPEGNFKCYACQKTGDFVTLLVRVEGRARYVVESGLRARYGKAVAPISQKQVEKHHAALPNASELIRALVARGVNDESMRRFRLGADGDRITIPVPNNTGQYINIRKYLPDKDPGDKRPKMTNMRGRGGKPDIFPYSQLAYPKLVLCGGEIKAIAVAQRLNELGWGALCMTGAEGDWNTQLEFFFQGKEVYVCNDIDEAGYNATSRRCRRLSKIAKEVKAVYLPLDPLKYATGDVNDFIMIDEATATERLLEVLANAQPWSILEIDAAATRFVEDDDGEIYEVDLESVGDPGIVNKQVRCTLSISAIDEDPYNLTKKLQVVCNQDQENCTACPVFMHNTDVLEISATSPSLLAMIDTNKGLLRDILREAVGIPVCPAAQLNPIEHFKATETRAQKPLALTEHASGRVNIPAVFISDNQELLSINESYEVQATLLAHPKTQASTLLISQATPVADALDTFKLESVDSLRQFQTNGVPLKEYFAKQYDFLSKNVTRIYNRERLHAFIDLTFHSVLTVKPSMHDSPIKGCLELLIIGDSSQGKTEVSRRLSEFYQLGVKVDCKNTTVAGLIGGLEQMNGRWFAQWGILPTHDRRLVMLEELKGMPRETFSKLTETRTSGIAQIPKIKRAEARARTRLIVISNALKTNTTMSSYAYGCRAISELIKHPEDVRRFDGAVILNKDDMDPSIINQRMQHVEELYSSEDAHRLALWAWTRKLEDVVVQPEAWELCMSEAERLCSVYTDALPLFDRGTTKSKLLRWATACAARVFSTEDGIKLIVQPDHVRYIVELLEEEYKAKSHGYFDFSATHSRRVYNTDLEEMAKALAQLTPSPNAIGLLLQLQDLDAQDIMDVGGISKDEASLIVSRLVRAGALVREDRHYVKTPGMIEYLRNKQTQGEQEDDRTSY
jgi:hypothetical protein